MRSIILASRSTLYFSIGLVSISLWLWVCLLCMLLPYPLRHYISTRWAAFMLACANWICNIRYQVIGRENWPDAPVVLLSKHQSAWETMFLAFSLPRPSVFVLKKELLYLPFFGWSMALLHMIPIDRKKNIAALRDVIRLGKVRLKEGHWVVMFPEGTRMPVGETGKYRNSGALLAIEAGALIVPMAVNAGECWPLRSFIKKPGLVTVSFGSPISPQGKDADTLMQEVECWIEAEMRRISPQSYCDR